MSRAFWRTVWLEFQNLLQRRLAWLGWAGFCLAVLAVRFSPWLRQSYLPATRAQSLLLAVLEFLVPYFLVVVLAAALLPAFAGGEERSLWDTAAPCLLGRRGRGLARTLAAEGYALALCLSFCASAALLCGPGGAGVLSAEVTAVGDAALAPVWTVGRQAGFAVLSLGTGCALLALLVQLVSAHSRDLVTAAGAVTVLLMLAFLFHRFGFKPPLREINLWVFFRPYYFFLLELFPFSPAGNLLALGCVLIAAGLAVSLLVSHMPHALAFFQSRLQQK